MISVINTCIFLSSFIWPQNNLLNTKPTTTVPEPQDKTFKVQSLPFDLNGLHLQFQYVVEKDIYSENSEEMVLVIGKKLVDLKRKVVLLDLTMPDDDTNPSVSLAGISNAGYSPEDFDDVNFDGYKDIREECISCGGSLGNVEDIYLFDHHSKKFNLWQAVMGINVVIDPKNKTVKCYTKGSGDGGFDYQEIKFIGRGTELYEKDVYCVLINEKKPTFKVTYYKYMGKKTVAHKTRIITGESYPDPWALIEKLTK